MELIVHFCDEKRQERLNEYLFCLEKNLDNSQISVVHCLCMDGVNLPERIMQRENIRISYVKNRPTFAELIEYANKNVIGIAAISNLDIFFDHGANWKEAEQYILNNSTVVMALSRIEYHSEQHKFLDPNLANIGHAIAQDAWVFKTPLNVQNAGFEIGTMGADNAIADRLKKAGYFPINYATRYKIYHYDVCRGKTAANANQVHLEDSVNQNTVYSRYPEEDGAYLVPDIDKITSVDGIIAALGVDENTRYFIICDLLSRYIKINNRR